jgi:hypothetical protein
MVEGSTMSVSHATTAVEFTDVETDGGDAGPGIENTLADILGALIDAVDVLGYEPLPNSVTAGGFTIQFRGHRLRIGFGATMGY